MKTKKYKAFCPTCGELEIDKFGKVLHPHQDKILKELLKHSFKVSYADN